MSYILLNLTYLYFSSYVRNYTLSHSNFDLERAIDAKIYLLNIISEEKELFDYFTQVCIGLFIIQNISGKTHTLKDIKEEYDKFYSWNKMIDIKAKTRT